MQPKAETSQTIAKRDPERVMRLSRLGSFHQSRLSFMRILTRRMTRENWTFSRPVFEFDDKGVGHAVYCAQTPDRTYSLIAFGHDLPPQDRSDRVIATAWDSTFTMFDGVPDKADIERLRANIPLQEAGRVRETELSVSRANRSVRLWDHVVSRLAAGTQPDQHEVDKVGYLMRTTAVYGSGKLGAADREVIADRAECAAPFQIEMLSVFLTRTYVRDLVQHMAALKGGADAVTLDAEIARSMGIGNSTGLGMAPFLINHPKLFNNWIAAREEAIALVRNVEVATDAEIALFRDLLDRSLLSADIWYSEHPVQIAKLKHLRRDLSALAAHVAEANLQNARPWDRLYTWAEDTLGEDAQECLASLILEPYGRLVDHLADQMSDKDRQAFRIDGTMRVSDLRAVLERSYGWALNIDWSQKNQCARAWYVSAEKLEPRLGERFEEPIACYEQPLAPGRDAAGLYAALKDEDGNNTLAAFLLAHPEHRHSVRRAQIVAQAPYAEIRDNTIGSELMPIDMLRCKLSFFGATHFDPRSDRWVRICMFGNAPYPEELASAKGDDWSYPPATRSAT
ncbi:hypothetical protein HKX54_01325 [Sulfitobacter sp. M57]|uniref:hypothetical protein n=1 Tax=unclassified Sulfitobacter TaxID=196795 RepID=UPI0023E2156C|nr:MULTISPECIES: hypothetical protein [unclassified Sulfitobacter]MDF3413081.1 hypothetical protein [Sulfitobacter sp. KE5]MDF3421636.1 hypothetical protein [Sulfitobacter sp. KE43]MDF3431630.1 hypothetical protein [Sulfitobacter sp. KE42]MDF3457271.1 hypothetical protein [Sulfitobacter sp. S74]MDF3461173.1 hypothetical protein [Sulfitobacter sp. Ks18]